MLKSGLILYLLVSTTAVCAAQTINTLGVYYETNSTKPLFTSNRGVLRGGSVVFEDTEVYENSGWSFGVTIDKFLGNKKHFKFTTGVGYSKRGYSFDDLAFFVEDSTFHPLKVIVKKSDIEIPAIFSYIIEVNKFWVYPSSGIILGFKIEDSYTTIVYRDPQYSVTYIDSFNSPGPERLNLFIGAGIGYHFSEHFGIYLEPNLRINIRPFFGDGIVSFDEETKTKSLKIGLNYFFKDGRSKR